MKAYPDFQRQAGGTELLVRMFPRPTKIVVGAGDLRGVIASITALLQRFLEHDIACNLQYSIPAGDGSEK